MSFENNWNFIKQVYGFPCADPHPVIWFTTFFPAVAPALIDFISYGCRDIVKFKAGIGQPCGRIFKASAQKTYGPQLIDRLHNLLKFTRPIEAGLFWWFVADLAADTAARWTSLAYQLSGCLDLEETTTWSIEESLPQTFFANQPYPLGGLVRNERGTPGIAWPVGAVVPAGWHVQGSFTANVVAFRSDQPVGCKTWIRRLGGVQYDFPANVYPPGMWGNGTTGHYVFDAQNDRASGDESFVMMIMVDQIASLTSHHADWQASRLPILEWTVSPLSCFRDLTVSRETDPAGQNRRGRQPTIIDPAIRAIPRPHPHGPPGGKPRQ